MSAFPEPEHKAFIDYAQTVIDEFVGKAVTTHACDIAEFADGTIKPMVHPLGGGVICLWHMWLSVDGTAPKGYQTVGMANYAVVELKLMHDYRSPWKEHDADKTTAPVQQVPESTD